MGTRQERDRTRSGRGVVWVLTTIAGVSLANAARQWYLGAGPTSRQLSGLWLLLGFLAAVAAWAVWRSVRWAWVAAAVWVADALTTTIVGTALMYGGRPPITSVLPGTVVVAVLGGMIVRSVRRRTSVSPAR